MELNSVRDIQLNIPKHVAVDSWTTKPTLTLDLPATWDNKSYSVNLDVTKMPLTLERPAVYYLTHGLQYAQRKHAGNHTSLNTFRT